MKKILLITVFLFAHVCSHAQYLDRMYEYDASGNRVVRKILRIRSTEAHAGGADTADSEGVLRSYSESIGEFTVTVYPNPTAANVKLEISDYRNLGSGTASVYSPHGQLLQKLAVMSSLLEIDFSPYSPGVYLLRLEMDDYTDEWKVIKQ